MRIVVGITGSSGAVFAQDFLQQSTSEKYLIVSKWGRVLLKDELGISERDLSPYVKRQFSDDDLTAPLASGSNHIDAVVILPCSTSTLGKIASGIGDSLITRTAQVALKERRRLVLCPRETPLSTIALEQAAALSRAGTVIMPISPPLYFAPKSVQEYVSAFTEKLLAVIGEKSSKGWRAEELE
jgi:4-hydroxy-3-polyprenylbenzoate decarboxylase